MVSSIIKCKILVALLTILLPVILLFGPVTAAQSSRSFFYYNPDSSHSNLLRLKEAMDRLLSEGKTAVSFQPFVHQSDLDRIFNDQRPAFIFVPEWYLRLYGKEKGLHPLLVPVKKGSSSYRKVFLASTGNSADLQRSSMAMTNMGPDPDMLLNNIGFFKKGIDAAKLNVVTVPKDLDALFALAIGQVDTALVSRDTIDLVNTINPNIKNTVREVFVSDTIPLPVLCLVNGVATPAEIKKFKELFLSSGYKENRKQVMEMLHIDEWKDPAI